MEPLVNVINNHLQGTLHSDSKINPKSEGKEYCEVTLSSDNELYEAEGGKLKRLHHGVEKDCGVVNKWSKIEEKEDEDDQALSSNEIKQISPVSVSQQVRNSEEYIQINLGEGKENNLDEFKFGGGLQSCEDVEQLKKKTKKRHEMIIFATEPD